jgi:hypothetical protein
MMCMLQTYIKNISCGAMQCIINCTIVIYEKHTFAHNAGYVIYGHQKS